MIHGAPAEQLLREAWSALGGDPQLLELVALTGDATGLLPSIHQALPAVVAAVCASTLAASVLDAARNGGSPRSVEIDVEHVALAARSERHAREAGAPAPADLFAPLSRFWPTRDGWLRLHANYPWHRERALGVLGCGEHPGGVADAVRAWSASELEDALARAGGVGFAVRRREEWEAHPQGRAVAALPLLELDVGPGPGRSPGRGRAAAAVRVLDLTRVIAGPVASRTLAAWGADVLRIDSPHLPELPAQALDTLPGKRSSLLDFTQARGRARLEELLGQADVLVQGYRPGALDRFGLGRDDLVQRHPHLTVVALSAWGSTGPWARRRGFDSLVQCPTGIAAAEAVDDEAPGALPAQVLDHATGYLAAAGALLGLAGVARGERPRWVRCSLAQTARWLTGAGTAERPPARSVSPAAHLVSLSGARRAVAVIAPPGRIGDLIPGWTATTQLGADLPVFGGAPGA